MMYTTVDKAIVAAVMSIVQLANVLGLHWGLDETTVTIGVSLITPVLVHFVPNLPKDK